MQAAEKPVPTSLKLPAAVKRDIDEAARAAGTSSHAYMIDVLQKAVERVCEAFDVLVQGSDPHETFETIGGLIAHEMGHVPKRGEHLQLSGLHFVVLHTKGGAVRWFKVSRVEEASASD